ncbi:MAG TPA: universal stress protein [Opitutaceae bacterium]|jgi:nucleotide-binding universal stress UspA family protein|nr:universal stress protein [Opitutaceae bacterium]
MKASTAPGRLAIAQRKTILAAVDRSDASHAVLQEAAALAGSFQAHVILVHVTEPPMAWDAAQPAKLTPALADTSRRFAELGLSAEARELYGEPGRQLAEEAGRLRPDLVIVGTRARGVLRGLLLGRTASYLLRHASCPLLVVPNAHRRPA